MVHSLSISELDPQSLRDFLSPKITSLDTLSTFIFGLRFRFATKKLPTTWRRDEQNQKAFKAHGVSVATSNSSCDSGKLVIAGYLLFKAPNTTHRARYLQFRLNFPIILRSSISSFINAHLQINISCILWYNAGKTTSLLLQQL